MVSSVHLYSSSFWLEVLAVSNNPRIRILKDCKTVNQESFANYHLYLPMGPFNNYVRGQDEGIKNVCFCPRSEYKNYPRRAGEGGQKMAKFYPRNC